MIHYSNPLVVVIKPTEVSPPSTKTTSNEDKKNKKKKVCVFVRSFDTF